MRNGGDSMNVLRLHPEDNVGIALADIAATADRPAVPKGHKLALTGIAKDHAVRRYGQVIGQALADISEGEHVHSHNLGMTETRSIARAGALPGEEGLADLPGTFMGYAREDGRAGTRNYIGILTTVNCSGSVARFAAEAAEKSGLLDKYPNIDGIVPISHGTGCGMAGRGEAYDLTLRTLAGFAQNPNFGAILMIGLGCEVMQIPALTGHPAMRDQSRFRFLSIQTEGGTRATVDAAVTLLDELAQVANRTGRQPVSVSNLTVGLQCGGSDGLSGITANPALGIASDLLVAKGGTSILSETPEIFGAEHLLTSRATSPEIASRLLERIEWWTEYCARHGVEMDNNPSPGNKRGGLTTILEKSLGAVAKSGNSPLNGVYRYAEKIDRHGLVFMDSPGYDPCSVTGQVASGANLIVFTTGRGSVSGYKPVPCLKLSSNTDLYNRMKGDIDVNCGDVIEGSSLSEKGREIYTTIISIASGNRTKSEQLGFGSVEFVPWQIGAVL